jgi:uncharacterized SAM-dependent methyltransferase
MYLDCHQDQSVTFANLEGTVDFVAGESILTEISCKFHLDQLQAYLATQGLKTVQCWGDRQNLFSLILTQVVAD